ncbi:nucleotidyltransferase domain-containing protein [Candidatus Dependentiae bacterium]|nr:MAG: nucleotidyltransferase domain-containing protein [Candidatus Dependentiae bacterium]
MLKMEQRHLIIVQSIIDKYAYKIAAFGSRVHGNPKKFSDLDLCVMEPIPTLILGQMQEDFEESNLPFTVDIVRWERCSEEFKNRIKHSLYEIKKTG